MAYSFCSLSASSLDLGGEHPVFLVMGLVEVGCFPVIRRAESVGDGWNWLVWKGMNFYVLEGLLLEGVRFQSIASSFVFRESRPIECMAIVRDKTSI